MTFKKIYTFALGLTCLALSAMMYVQYILGVQPCLLCWMQRILLNGLFIIFILALCLPARSTMWRGIIHAASFIFSALGLLTAIRQIWLQHISLRGTIQCLPDAKQIFHALPLQDIFHIAYTQSAYCAEVRTLFGVSIASWSAGCFLLLLLITLRAMLGSQPPHSK